MNSQKPLPIMLVLLLVISATAGFAAALCQLSLFKPILVFLLEAESYQVNAFSHQPFVILSLVAGVFAAIVYQADRGNFRAIRWVVRFIAMGFAVLLYWSFSQGVVELYQISSLIAFCLFAIMSEFADRHSPGTKTPVISFFAASILICLGLFVAEKALNDPASNSSLAERDVSGSPPTEKETTSNLNSGGDRSNFTIQRIPARMIVRVNNLTDSTMGSGVIVGIKNSQVYVLTAAHLAQNGDRLTVEQFNSKTNEVENEYSSAKIIASDEGNDLALLRVLALSPAGMEAIRLPQSPFSAEQNKAFSVITFGCTSGNSPTAIAGTAKRGLIRINENAPWRLVWEFTEAETDEDDSNNETKLDGKSSLDSETENTKTEIDINDVRIREENPKRDISTEATQNLVGDRIDSTSNFEGRSGGAMLDSNGKLVGIASGESDGKSYFAHVNEIIKFVQSKNLKKYFD